jgi:AraC-like DNA-binding protein
MRLESASPSAQPPLVAPGGAYDFVTRAPRGGGRLPHAPPAPRRADDAPVRTRAVASLAAVTTMLTPDERIRVDAAGVGLYTTTHRESIDDVIRDVRERGAAAVVMSVSRCGSHELSRVARMVREFPRVPAVALLSDVAHGTPHTVLSLGRSGVTALIDVRQATGWRALRATLMTERADGIERQAVARLAIDLAGAPEDCVRFFELLFTCPPALCSVRQLAQQFDVGTSTFMSRFFRAGLPAPKRYLAYARLVRAARLLESAGFSVAHVADQLDFSSPQSFGRHVKTLLGMTAQRFRETYDGEGMLERFRAELVTPFTETLRRFRPLTSPPGRG